MTHREWTVPGADTAPGFGKVTVRETPSGREVTFTILMPPQGREAEGWQTGVALDGSRSMNDHYGKTLKGQLSPEVTARYRRKGWLAERVVDGRRVESLSRDGSADALKQGYLTMSDNTVEPLARRFVGYLANELDADGGTTVIYWACAAGDGLEVVGDVTAAECATMRITGPRAPGEGTRLLPAVRYFVERFADAERGMYVFLTDGRLDDFDALVDYCGTLARDIADGRRAPVKFVIVGVGALVDAGQLQALDDLDTGTDVDLWDHKLAADMRDIVEIFAEVVDDHLIVAPSGVVTDDAGRVVARFTDGVPARIRLVLPTDATAFQLEAGEVRVHQPLVVPHPVL